MDRATIPGVGPAGSRRSHSCVATRQKRKRYDDQLVSVQSHAVRNSTVTHLQDEYDEMRTEFKGTQEAVMARDQNYPQQNTTRSSAAAKAATEAVAASAAARASDWRCVVLLLSRFRSRKIAITACASGGGGGVGCKHYAPRQSSSHLFVRHIFRACVFMTQGP